MRDKPTHDRSGATQSDRRTTTKGDTARGASIPRSLQRSSRQIAGALRRALTS